MAEDTRQRFTQLEADCRFVVHQLRPFSARLVESGVSAAGAVLAHLNMAAECACHDSETDEEDFVDLAKVACRAAVLGHKEKADGCSS